MIKAEKFSRIRGIRLVDVECDTEEEREVVQKLCDRRGLPCWPKSRFGLAISVDRRIDMDALIVDINSLDP